MDPLGHLKVAGEGGCMMAQCSPSSLPLTCSHHDTFFATGMVFNKLSDIVHAILWVVVKAKRG